MAESPGPPPTAPPPQEPPPPPDQQQPAGNRDERMWAMFCHLAALGIFVIPLVGNIVGPLVIWLVKKEDYPLVEDQGRESLNFQITMTIGFAISMVLALVIIGLLLGLGLIIFDVVMIIIATIRANNGERYRYPFAIRFIK